VTPELDAVLAKALERDRDARFQDALSMAAALERATPLASALEVIEWVEKLAGPKLQHRAELVRRAEALSWESVAVPAPTPVATQTPPRGSVEHRGWSATVAVSSKSPRTPTLLGLPQAPPRDIALSALAVTESVVAVSGDRDAAVPNGAQNSRRRKALGLALGIVAASVIASFGASSLSRGARQSSVAATREALVARAALATVAPAPAVTAPNEAASPPLRLATARRDLAVSEAQSAADDTPEPGPSKPPAAALRRDPASTAAGHGDRKSAPVRFHKTSHKPPRASDGAQPAPPSDHCTPPWTVNEQQVKVFKAECLR
jgi:hypothetical protein